MILLMQHILLAPQLVWKLVIMNVFGIVFCIIGRKQLQIYWIQYLCEDNSVTLQMMHPLENWLVTQLTVMIDMEAASFTLLTFTWAVTWSPISSPTAEHQSDTSL